MDLTAEQRDQLSRTQITAALHAVDDAGLAIIRFFSHAVKGDFKPIKVERGTRRNNHRSLGAPPRCPKA